MTDIPVGASLSGLSHSQILFHFQNLYDFQQEPSPLSGTRATTLPDTTHFVFDMPAERGSLQGLLIWGYFTCQLLAFAACPPNRAQNESYNQASWNPRLDHSSTTVKRTGPGVRPTSWDLLSQFLASTSVYPSIKWECEYLPERVIMRIK